MPPDTIDALFARYGRAYQWLATATCMIGAMTLVLAQTTVNVAIADIMGAFGVGRDQAQWVSTGFFAAMTAGMLLSGWLVTVFGERKTYAAALALFIAGCSLGGVAPNIDALTLGRVMQGAGAGIVQPLAMAVTFKVFPPERRGTAMGIFSMGIVFAPAIGPTLGGVVIDMFSWRHIFFLSVPSAAAAGALGLLFMPSRQWPTTVPRFDFIGFGFLCAALTCLLTGLADGHRYGWSSDRIVGLFAFGLVAAVTFVLRQIRSPVPLLKLTLFAHPQFAAATLIGFFAGGVFLASTFIMPLFVQTVQSFTPLRAGLLLMPGGLSLLILFPLAGRISDALPAPVLIAVGLVSFGTGFLLLSTADRDTSFWTLVFFTMFIRVGLAFTTPVVAAAALRPLPSDLVTYGSSTLNFVRQLGAAFSVNCLVAYMDSRVPVHSEAFTILLSEGQHSVQAFLAIVQGALVDAGIADSAGRALALHYLGQVLYAQATASGFSDAFVALAAVSFFGLLPTWILTRARLRP